VNNAGEIVGGPSEREGGSHPPFLYSDGKMTDLNTLTDLPSGWHLKTAAAINDSGQIVGNGQNGDAQFHAFLLTPVP
jgi:probable HAF family extracellular repeat protein